VRNFFAVSALSFTKKFCTSARPATLFSLRHSLLQMVVLGFGIDTNIGRLIRSFIARRPCGKRELIDA